MRWLLPIFTLIVLTAAPQQSRSFDWSGRIDELAENLDAPSPTLRRQTLEKLGTYSSSQVARYLLRGLEDDNQEVRTTAARLVGRARVHEAVPILVGWLTDQEEDVRQTACDALGRIGDERALVALSRVMADSSPVVRRAAVDALATIGTDRAVVALIGRLGDSHPTLRQAAANGLGRLANRDAVVPLVSRLQDPVQPVRLAVIGALARIGDERSSAALLQSLRDQSPEVRAAALGALARLRSEEVVIPAVGLLNDENDEVRIRAIAALGAIGNERAIGALIASLRDSTLGATATSALIEVGAEAIEPLCDVLRQSSDQSAREAALRVLTAIGDPRAAQTVIDELETGSSGLPEERLILALGSLASPAAVIPLIERLGHDRPEIRLASLLSLSRNMGPGSVDPRANDALLELVSDGSDEERLLALALLARIGEPRVVPFARDLAHRNDRAMEETDALLRRLATNQDRELQAELVSARATGWPLRALALRALGRAHTAEALQPLLELLQNDRRASMRHEAALALGELGGEETIGALAELVTTERPIDRAAVVLALGHGLERTPSSAGQAVLRRLLSEGELSLALRAADALARAGDPSAVPAFIPLLESPEVALRRKSVEVLGELGGDQARDALVGALDDDDPLVRGLATWALGKIGGDGLATTLVGQLDDNGWSVAINTAGALANLADPTSSEQICTALEEGRDVVYLTSNLLLAAAATNAPCAQSAALEALRSHRAPQVRSAAARSLRTLLASDDVDEDDQDVRAALRTCLSEDEVPNVQELCRRALSAETDNSGSDGQEEDWIEFYLYSADGRRLRERGRYILVLPNGLVKAGITDSNAFARETPVIPGEYRVLDPSTDRLPSH